MTDRERRKHGGVETGGVEHDLPRAFAFRVPGEPCGVAGDLRSDQPVGRGAVLAGYQDVIKSQTVGRGRIIVFPAETNLETFPGDLSVGRHCRLQVKTTDGLERIVC